ncbi:MAG: hypothetical protein ACQGVC_09035 [Myxococcota bacterium]
MPDRRREGRARAIGAAVALACMAVSWLAIQWPAPGISLAVGCLAYLVARGR